MLGLSFSSELDFGSYIVSIAKTSFKKIGVLIRSMTFLSFEAPLYLCKSTIQLYMEYCCHDKAGALSCFLYLLDYVKVSRLQNSLPAEHFPLTYDLNG